MAENKNSNRKIGRNVRKYGNRAERLKIHALSGKTVRVWSKRGFYGNVHPVGGAYVNVIVEGNPLAKTSKEKRGRGPLGYLERIAKKNPTMLWDTIRDFNSLRMRFPVTREPKEPAERDAKPIVDFYLEEFTSGSINPSVHAMNASDITEKVTRRKVKPA